MHPSEAGRIALDVWTGLREHYGGLDLDAFALMPDHVHGVVLLRGGGASLVEVVRTFKSVSARRINLARALVGVPVWQRGYHDAIVRGPRHLDAVRRYIALNAARAWEAARQNNRRPFDEPECP